MNQHECSTEARMYVKRKPKEGTTRSGATAPTERHLRQPSDTAPTKHQCATKARHTKGARQNRHSAWFSKTYHLDTWILYKTCLKHSNFVNRKTVCTIVRTWNIIATAMGQGTEENKTSEDKVQNTAITTQNEDLRSAVVVGLPHKPYKILSHWG